MTAVVENIRQQIDRLAPEEVQELFADLECDYAIRVVRTADSPINVEELSAVDQAKLAALRQDIQIAADSLDRGEGIEIDWDAKLARRHEAFALRQKKSA
ncbi:MAG: hypothetical protein B7Z47_05435 [Chthoniobacter sp. 12-60-6]|nr:MAG: hypothetical protein B7Z47_05435 [Chthoniobacter sp. 12-60-6]